MSSIRSLTKLRIIQIQRAFSQKPKGTSKKSEAKSDSVNANVPGLTSYVIKQRPGPLGPGASTTGDYKNREYFCYDRFSYYGAEVELAEHRCPQPSAVKGTQ